ncbi:MAG: NAD(P)H-quinone oxidoreductase [Burkholderiaceae bacterium]
MLDAQVFAPEAGQVAMHISAAGGPEVLLPRRIAQPVLGEEELLIEVHFAGVNRHDCNQRRRGPTPAHSDVPGLEVAGVVRAVGARVRSFAPGDRVCALTDGGGYAEYVAAPAALAFRLGDGLSMAQGAALPEALFTIWHNFFNVAQLAAGETVLIHGGTSGVGSLAIQVLGQLGHAVYVTCSTDEKCALARRLGARGAINYRTEDFVQRVAELTHGCGVDVILDMAGGRYSEQNVRALARRGRLVHLSPGDGAAFSAPLRDIMAKEVRVTGSLLRPLPGHEKTAIAHQLRRAVWPLVEAGAVQPLIQRVFPLSEAAQAHACLESGDVAGKIVLQSIDTDERRKD